MTQPDQVPDLWACIGVARQDQGNLLASVHAPGAIASAGSGVAAGVLAAIVSTLKVAWLPRDRLQVHGRWNGAIEVERGRVEGQAGLRPPVSKAVYATCRSDR